MSAVCQDSLAWQQNINCLQLAEFPPLSRGLSQSDAGLVETEHVHHGNRATLALLADSPHAVLSVSIRLTKYHTPVN